MCGICGYIHVNPAAFAPDPIYAMTDTLRHRGPDGEGYHLDATHGWAMGHRRLKVIDLSDRGRQPMSDAAGTLWITYNGEVYNFADLRATLQARGHRFQSGTDTEVILYAYKEYGRRCVDYFNGDFAFALWDGDRQELLVYRDRVGVRPLYTLFQGGVFAFASEIKALFKHPALGPPCVDREKMPEYFGHLYSFGEDTLYRNVQEVQPGWGVIYAHGRVTKERYHDFTYDPAIRRLPEDEQIEGFRTLLDDAIRIRLTSDVPLGVYLSGGLDSSYMTARLTAGSTVPVHTFSLGFDRGQFNEFAYSSVVARQFGTCHTPFLVDAEDCTRAMDAAIWHYDEPLPHLVAVPQYYLAREAKRHITVALAGSGGDELLAGYAHYQAAWACQRAHQTAPALTGSAHDRSPADAYQRGLADRHVASEFKSCTQRYVVEQLFAGPIPDYRDQAARFYVENDYPDFLSKMLYMDFKTHVVAMMNKDDKMNMAWGVEGRFPYLDHRLIQFALSMSPELKIREGVGKWTLKRLGAAYFEPAFIHREKQAFPTPAETWLARLPADWVAERLLAFLNGRLRADRLKPWLLNPQAFCATGNHTRRRWGMYGLARWLSGAMTEPDAGVSVPR